MSVILLPVNDLSWSDPYLIREVAETDIDAPYSVIADQLQHALEILEQIKSPRELRPFQSIRQIQNFVESVDAEYIAYPQRLEQERVARIQAAERAEQQRRAARADARTRARAPRVPGAAPSNPNTCPWPPPPVPGTDTIVPITSYRMLCEESVEQNNCIQTYWRMILGKGHRVYVYRLMQPQRVTFVIVKRSANTWRLSEIRARSNRKASKEARRVVEKWLYSYSLAATLPC
ncbi:MAG: hypothetical protein E4H02_10600 [Lentisphaerales bacterium]|nr:MAG: hypothetical protein E4H02_10600 [Lentisphaerales bacterium]